MAIETKQWIFSWISATKESFVQVPSVEILVTWLYAYSGREGEVRVHVHLLSQSLGRIMDSP